ncbi:YolD-like family protein [Bacillus gobiensis]|uniref:YolD-like family protein n=1 Tax=Bacillus gobiensis TaxID=1441095 RepID=UPI003D1E94EF
MLRDRKNIKWTSLMLPGHVAMLKKELLESKKINRPVLDEQQIEDMENLICESMEYIFSLQIKVYDDGFFREIEGYVHCLNPYNKQLHLKDLNGDTNFIKFKDIVSVQR